MFFSYHEEEILKLPRTHQLVSRMQRTDSSTRNSAPALSRAPRAPAISLESFAQTHVLSAPLRSIQNDRSISRPLANCRHDRSATVWAGAKPNGHRLNPELCESSGTLQVHRDTRAGPVVRGSWFRGSIRKTLAVRSLQNRRCRGSSTQTVPGCAPPDGPGCGDWCEYHFLRNPDTRNTPLTRSTSSSNVCFCPASTTSPPWSQSHLLATLLVD